MKRLLFCLFLAGTLAGCGMFMEDWGKEGKTCFSNGTCRSGLTCDSDQGICRKSADDYNPDDSCAEKYCLAQTTACYADSNCMAVVNCINGCIGNTPAEQCVASCLDYFGDPFGSFEALGLCLARYCAD